MSIQRHWKIVGQYAGILSFSPYLVDTRMAALVLMRYQVYLWYIVLYIGIKKSSQTKETNTR